MIPIAIEVRLEPTAPATPKAPGTRDPKVPNIPAAMIAGAVFSCYW
jgi:hypothetical protein